MSAASAANGCSKDCEHASKAVMDFAAGHGAKSPKAVAKITDDQEQI